VPTRWPGGGLDSGFNSNSCRSRHSQPAALGSGPSASSPQVPQPNPEIAAGQADGVTNTIPTFVTADGMVREAGFVKNAQGTPTAACTIYFLLRERRTLWGAICGSPALPFNWRRATSVGPVLFHRAKRTTAAQRPTKVAVMKSSGPA
jgi:hypothetical protein